MRIERFHTAKTQSTYYKNNPFILSWLRRYVARASIAIYIRRAMIPDPFAFIALLLWLRYVHLCVKHRRERRIRAIAAIDREKVRRRRFLRRKRRFRR